MLITTWLGLLSASTTVNARVGGVAPGWMLTLLIALITGTFTMLIGTTCTTLPLLPPTVHGAVRVSVSLVVVGFATSSKSYTRLFSAALMSATVPLKVMVASAVPSPAVKLSPVVWLNVTLPLVTASVSVSGSAAPLLWMASFWLAALLKVSNWVSPATCLPGLARLGIGLPIRMLFAPRLTRYSVPLGPNAICVGCEKVAVALSPTTLPAAPVPANFALSKLLNTETVLSRTVA